MTDLQIHLLKQARVYLVNVQSQFPAVTETWQKLNELIAEIEEMLGVE